MDEAALELVEVFVVRGGGRAGREVEPLAVVLDGALGVDGDELAGRGEDAVGPSPEFVGGLPAELVDLDAVFCVGHEVADDTVEVFLLAPEEVVAVGAGGFAEGGA